MLPLKIDVEDGEVDGEVGHGVDGADEDKGELLLGVRGAAAAAPPPTGDTPPDHQSEDEGDDDGERQEEAEDGHGGEVGGDLLPVVCPAQGGGGEGSQGVGGAQEGPGHAEQAREKRRHQGDQGAQPTLLRVHIRLQYS